jgi:integrase
LNTIRQIISAAEASGNIMELVVPLLISTGLRRGELLDLKFSDIDFDNKKLTVDSSRVIAGKKVVVKDTKTKSSVRTVYLPETIVSLLKKRKVEYMKNKLALGSKFNDTDLVISKEDGSGYYPETISNLFYRMLAKNDLPHMRLHDLRAINATVMISECKIDPRTASQRLGHSNSNFTLSVYANLLKSANEDAAEKLDSALFKKAEIS